jgi:flagellar hook-associated protein 3 FlgL
MRVTQKTTFNNLNRYLNDNREALAKFQQQLSSGKRVTKASDDGIAFSTGRELSNAIRKNEQYQSNIGSGLTKARYAEEALSGMADALIDFKSLALNASSDSLNAEDRESLADQVAGIKDRLVDLGNTKFNGAHLFAGTKTSELPFEIDGAAQGGVRYDGNAKEIEAQISDTSRVSVSVSGSELRNSGSGDLFEIMQNTEDALRANDRAAINGQLDNIDDASNHVINLTSTLGSNTNRMDFLNEQLKGQAIDQDGERSRLIDTDFAEAFSNVQKYETSYQAALSVHSRIIQTSLLDFLR